MAMLMLMVVLVVVTMTVILARSGGALQLFPVKKRATEIICIPYIGIL